MRFCVWGTGEQGNAGRRAGACGLFRGIGTQWEAHRKAKAAANAGAALGLNLALHFLHQLACNGQAQAGAAVFAAGGVIGLYKGFKQRFGVVIANADAAVFNAEAHALRVVRIGFRPHHNMSSAGELDGVAEQVEKNLF